MSDNIKVSKLPSTDAIDDTSRFYVVISSTSGTDTYSRNCTFNTLKSAISTDFQVENMQKNISQLRTDTNAITSDVATLKTTAQQTTTSVNSLLTSVNSIQSTVNDLTADVNTLSGTAGRLDSALTQQTSRIDYLADLSGSATPDKYGTIKVGYATTGDNYKVQLDSNGNAFVNVPGGGGGGTDPRINALADMSAAYIDAGVSIPRTNIGKINEVSSSVETVNEDIEEIFNSVDRIAEFDADSNLSSGLLYDLSSEVSCVSNKKLKRCTAVYEDKSEGQIEFYVLVD